MKTLKELQEERATIVAQMETLVNERSNNMTEADVQAVKSFKDEIKQIDLQIEAINEVRSVAIASARPPEDKKADADSEFRATFKDYLKGNITNAQLQERIMQAGTATAGKETVPPEFLKTLLEKILEYGMFYSDANIITTANHGELTIPTADDTANAGAWTAEGGTISPADLVTGNVTMNAYKCATGVIVSTELMEDAYFDIENYIASALGVRLARTFEASFINGDGTGKPQGIVTDTATVNTNTAVATGVTDAVMLSMVYSLSPAMRVGAKFYVSDEQRKEMDSWVDTAGRPLLQSQADATQANGTLTTLYGYPVKINLELGNPATIADVPAIFGNPQNYWIRNIRNIRIFRDDFSRSTTDEVFFTATTRLDGKPVSANPAFAKATITA